MYHSVGRPDRYGNVSVKRLHSDLAFLSQNYEIVDLPAILDNDSVNRRVAITFDDGWDDFYEHAVPVLREFEAEVTVFLVAKYLDSDVMMSHQQVTDLVDNHDHITVGNHTASHPHLSRIGDDAELDRQIMGAKRDLEERFGITVDRFSYPSGDYDQRATEVVTQSHDIAVSTIPRVVKDRYLDSSGVNRYLLPRIPAHYSKNRVRWEMTDLANRIRTTSSRMGLTSR